MVKSMKWYIHSSQRHTQHTSLFYYYSLHTSRNVLILSWFNWPHRFLQLRDLIIHCSSSSDTIKSPLKHPSDVIPDILKHRSREQHCCIHRNGYHLRPDCRLVHNPEQQNQETHSDNSRSSISQCLRNRNTCHNNCHRVPPSSNMGQQSVNMTTSRELPARSISCPSSCSMTLHQRCEDSLVNQWLRDLAVMDSEVSAGVEDGDIDHLDAHLDHTVGVDQAVAKDIINVLRNIGDELQESRIVADQVRLDFWES